MIPYYAILSEELPRRLFNIMRLDLATNTFTDPVLTTWQDRCSFCSKFQFRRLRFSGFPAELESPAQVIRKMQDEGYISDFPRI
jgi:hypothetical protein